MSMHAEACEHMSRTRDSIIKMESWLGDVKRVRIPRPKFGNKYPVEPPKDYLEDCGGDLGKQRRHDKDLTKATEELRRSLQEKL
ncbi:hypothetical protein HF086_015710 [Spodoptera exigua]|uniref:Uncharacterized protein n=1 Tax=Spodoptera exigua TaxID=7107 RepID=A0A922SJV3_SPOEX|nr:hypothetical protein HF086_015710 [Spodoptera exigua]